MFEFFIEFFFSPGIEGRAGAVLVAVAGGRSGGS
jgi:hypothetical protein